MLIVENTHSAWMFCLVRSSEAEGARKREENGSLPAVISRHKMCGLAVSIIPINYFNFKKDVRKFTLGWDLESLG